MKAQPGLTSRANPEAAVSATAKAQPSLKLHTLEEVTTYELVKANTARRKEMNQNSIQVPAPPRFGSPEPDERPAGDNAARTQDCGASALLPCVPSRSIPYRSTVS